MRDRLEIFVARTSMIFTLIGSAGILMMLFHICADVVFRQLLNAPIPATIDVVSRYYMISIAFFPLAWAEFRNDMISVEIFSAMFKGRAAIVKKITLYLITALIYFFLAIVTWQIAFKEFEVKSFTISLDVSIPIWPSYFILPIAFAVAGCVCLVKIYLLKSANSVVNQTVKQVS